MKNSTKIQQENAFCKFCHGFANKKKKLYSPGELV